MTAKEAATETQAEGATSPEPGSHATLYVVDVNFDWSAIQRRRNPDYRMVVLFGVDPEETGEPALLTPFPLFKAPEHAQLNTTVTSALTPAYYEKFGTDEELMFPLFKDVARHLNPYARHEIGYSLFMLAEDQDDRGAGRPPRLKAALRNTGNLFLMSAGVRWHMNSLEQNGLGEIYREEMEQFWGKAPTEPDPTIRGTDLQLHAMKTRGDAGILISQDWQDLADMGHGLTYTLMRNFNKGGTNQIVAVGNPTPEGYGTPIGAGYLAMRIPKAAK